MSAGDDHTFRATCRWSGSTGADYDAYDRNHDAACTPAEPTLALSSSPAFRGDPSEPDPEQLMALAASGG